MDVTLPDGTVIHGVPDGTTKAQLYAKLQAKGYDVTKLAPPSPEAAAAKKKWGQDPLPTDFRTAEMPSGTAALYANKSNAPAEYVNAVTEGLGPYATAAGTGAGIGSFLGPGGTAAGAVAGPLALAIGDTAAWGLGEAQKLIWGPNATTIRGPSDAWRDTTRALNLTHVPSEAPGVQVVSEASKMAGAAPGASRMVSNIARTAAPYVPTMARPVANFFGQRTPVATDLAAGFGSGAGSNIAAQIAPDNPWAQFAGGLAGGFATGSLAGGVENAIKSAIKPKVTAATIEDSMTAAYKAAHDAGVHWSPDAAQKAKQAALASAGKDLAPSATSDPTLVDALNLLTDRIASSPTGTLTSREVELWRKDFRRLTAPLTDDPAIAAKRVLESIDNFAADPANTLNTTRGRVIDLGNTAKTMSDKLRVAQGALASATTPAEQAAAQKAVADLEGPAKAAVDQFKTHLDNMARTDPQMKDVADAHRVASNRAAQADRSVATATDEYTAATNAHMTAEANAVAANAAYEAAKAKYPSGNPILNKFKGTATKAQDAADIAGGNVTEARQKQLAAERARSVKESERDNALADMQRKQLELANANKDAAAKSSQRTEKMKQARGAYPDLLNAEQFGAMRDAALNEVRVANAGRNPGQISDQVTQQIRTKVSQFIKQNKGYDFNRLPTATQRELQKFVRGGGTTERIVNFAGNFLAPGVNLASLASGGIFALGGGPGAALAQTAASMGAKASANAMAKSGFNKVSNMVAQGLNLPVQRPKNVFSSAARNAALAPTVNDRKKK